MLRQYFGSSRRMTKITIFANFYIDTEERLLRMQDSFLSFYLVKPSKWVVNIRGKFKHRAATFLRKHLDEELTLTFLHSKTGWFYDTASLLQYINTKYLMIWMEDHINIAGIDYYKSVLEDIESTDIDLLYYTFHNIDSRYDHIPISSTETIYYFLLDAYAHKIMQQNYPGAYIIWYGAIMKNALFRKIILNPPRKSERKYPVDTPFDFEKNATQIQWLPLLTGFTRKEFFASVDDDRKPGYSLQSRGLYPIREGRKSYAHKSTNTE